MPKEKAIIKRALQQRIKELHCLHSISDIIERSGNSIENILQDAVAVLPVSWQYPEIASARILYKEMVFTTPIFSESKWLQSSTIMESGKPVGRIEIHYNKEMPLVDEGPFTKEERGTLDAITKSISKALERINMIRQLEETNRYLEDSNQRLKNDLQELKDMQSQFNASIKSNMEILLTPLLQRLKSDGKNPEKTALLLEKGLNRIVSPFLFSMSKKYTSLTKSELQIAKMIKEGLSTKQIAEIRNVSVSTVQHQRENIRSKIGLSNKGIGLSTYLRLMADTL